MWFVAPVSIIHVGLLIFLQKYLPAIAATVPLDSPMLLFNFFLKQTTTILIIKNKITKTLPCVLA